MTKVTSLQYIFVSLCGFVFCCVDFIIKTTTSQHTNHFLCGFYSEICGFVSERIKKEAKFKTLHSNAH